MYRFKENNTNYELVEKNIFWEQNPNRKGDWTLCKETQKMGKNWLSDKVVVNQYGWVEPIRIGKDMGKFKAQIPVLCEVDSDHEDYKECETIGIFTDVLEAKKAVLEANHL